MEGDRQQAGAAGQDNTEQGGGPELREALQHRWDSVLFGLWNLHYTSAVLSCLLYALKQWHHAYAGLQVKGDQPQAGAASQGSQGT